MLYQILFLESSVSPVSIDQSQRMGNILSLNSASAINPPIPINSHDISNHSNLVLDQQMESLLPDQVLHNSISDNQFRPQDHLDPVPENEFHKSLHLSIMYTLMMAA